MFVKDYMTRHPIMIEPDKRVTEAQKLMSESKLRHLLVVGDGKRLLGLITREQLHISPEKLNSLDVWEITRFLADLTVKNVMVKRNELYSISPDATLEDAAEIMSKNKIGCLPVIDVEIVVGIITETDLLIELQNLLGVKEKGWRVTIRVPDQSGELMKITSVISSKGWDIMALGSVRAPKAPEYWDIVLKVSHCTRDELVQALEEIEGQQVIDARETTIRI
jgi:acetoin utilization protein AcuB